MKNTFLLLLVLSVTVYVCANERYTVAQWFEDMTYILEKDTNCTSSGITCYSDEDETTVTTNIDEVQRIKVDSVKPVKNLFFIHPDISFCRVTKTNIESLIFPEADFTIPYAMTNVDFSQNRISNIPDAFGFMKNVKSLYLYQNNLETLPGTIGSMESLVSIYASDNKLKSIPESIKGLKNLSYLDLNSNMITSLPQEIGELSSLETLRLSNNQLDSLPKEISQMQNLSFLYLDGNKLAEVPNEIGSLQKIQQLYLNKNNLVSLPDSIFRPPMLTNIQLSENKLTKLPEGRSSDALKTLYVDNNDLRECPVLPQITTLIVDHNKNLKCDISTLPRSILMLQVEDTLCFGTFEWKLLDYGCKSSCVSEERCTTNPQCECDLMKTTNFCPSERCLWQNSKCNSCEDVSQKSQCESSNGCFWNSLGCLTKCSAFTSKDLCPSDCFWLDGVCKSFTCEMLSDESSCANRQGCAFCNGACHVADQCNDEKKSDDSKGGLSGVAIFFIVLAVIVCVGAIAFFVVKKLRSRAKRMALEATPLLQ